MQMQICGQSSLVCIIASLILIGKNDVKGQEYSLEDHDMVDNVLEQRTTTSRDPKDVRFFVYSDPARPNNSKEVKINDIGTLDRANMVKGDDVIILIHGWLNNRTALSLLRNAYLSKGVRNIVAVDWQPLATNPAPFPLYYSSYFGALKNIPTVGLKIAEFINFLYKNDVISGGSQVHVIGESLGAHVAGSTGLFSKLQYNLTIGRITGLDPAGPFTKLLTIFRLNKKYAEFVDAIHSDAALYGTGESLGHADFFINGGKGQNIPGCDAQSNLVNSCAHLAARVLYYKSILGEEFKGCQCKPLPAKFLTVCGKLPTCPGATAAGENCPSSARGDYYVKTSVDLSMH